MFLQIMGSDEIHEGQEGSQIWHAFLRKQPYVSAFVEHDAQSMLLYLLLHQPMLCLKPPSALFGAH